MVKQKVATGILTSIFLMFPAGGHRASALDKGWERVPGAIFGTARIACVKGIDGTDRLYAGTSDGLYVTTDRGKRWIKEDGLGSGVGVTDMAFSGEDILVATNEGLYIGRAGKTWRRVPGKKDLEGVLAIQGSGKATALAWSSNELFMLENGRWQHISPKTSRRGIEDVAYKNGLIYAGVEGEVFCSFDKGRSWGKCPVPKGVKWNGDGTEGSMEEDVEYPPFIRKIEHAGSPGAAVATGRGIFMIQGRADVSDRIDTTGLPASAVSDVLNSEKGLFAAAGNKLFLYSPAECAWQPVFENAAGGAITCLMIIKDKTDRAWFWVTAGNGIYSRRMDSFSAFARPWLQRPLPGHEPSIGEVHRMAVDYAEVNPKKIKRWRSSAKWKAMMPKVSLGFSESRDDNIEIYKNASTSYIVEGPREIDTDWSIDLTWDLSDLVWNESQTSIDVRSKLMVQLRDDILEEVTRLYFERKRLLSELEQAKGKDRDLSKKQLRIEELTAYIDALTGGAFSKAMENSGACLKGTHLK